MMSSYGDGRPHKSHPKPTNAKLAQLEQFTVRTGVDGTKNSAVFNGAPLPNVDTSLKAGPRGPVSIDDPVARERVSHFDHERIPERVVHARGAGAHGFFNLHTSLSDVTTAKVLTETGKEVPMFVRFSTVLGSNGAAETAREVRGFATRFYTDEGNWDIVGNNIPVFFIQDGIKFPDLVHAGKPDPQIHLPQAQTAHDNFWDFISLMPESTHMIAWMLSDRTIPRSYRMMAGFGVNTYVLVGPGGKRTFVKFHWKPHQGVHGLLWDEALKLGGQDPDFLRRDLAEAIEAGGYPIWELGVQLIPEENENDFEFDLLDCTKLVPEEQVPIKWVGTMTLNRNPTNYFSETEQVAFCTSNIVPGIDYSNDPMLQLRNFSYFDTQLSRLGGPNFNHIPINRSLCPFITMTRDGFHSDVIKAGPHYHPNRFELPTVGQMNGANFSTDGESFDAQTQLVPGHQTFAPFPVHGMRGRARGPKFAEYVSQAQLFYNSLSPVEQQHLQEAAIFEVGRVDDRGIQERMMKRFAEIDYEMGVRIATGFGIEVEQPAKLNHGQASRGQNPFSMLDSTNNEFPLAGRKIGIFVLNGYDYVQAQTISTSLTAAGVICMLIGDGKGPAYPRDTSSGALDRSKSLSTNFSVEGCRSTYFDALFFPDGNDIYRNALSAGRVIHFAREAYGHCKAIGAAGVATEWLAHECLASSPDLKFDSSKNFSVSKGVVLGHSITSDESTLFGKLVKGLYDSATFGGAFATAVSQHRAWDRDTSKVAF